MVKILEIERVFNGQQKDLPRVTFDRKIPSVIKKHKHGGRRINENELEQRTAM